MADLGPFSRLICVSFQAYFVVIFRAKLGLFLCLPELPNCELGKSKKVSIYREKQLFGGHRKVNLSSNFPHKSAYLALNLTHKPPQKAWEKLPFGVQNSDKSLGKQLIRGQLSTP